MNTRRPQRGATLVISLILLVTLTLFVLSTMYGANTNLRVVGNMQAQRQLEATAQKGIEDRISSLTFFEDAIGSTGVWPGTTSTVTAVENGYTATFHRPKCVWGEPEEGNSALNPLVPEQTIWEVRATAADPVTGGNVDVTQGVRMRMLAGNCPL
jgi:Tfp pilus assembly protein PilX